MQACDFSRLGVLLVGGVGDRRFLGVMDIQVAALRKLAGLAARVLRTVGAPPENFDP